MKIKTASRGFTLIELLTVIAIIGILAAIIIPTTGAVRTAAKKAKTRTQFNQWGAAFNLFKTEYGYYPILRGNMVNGSGVNRNSTSIANADTIFQELLSGRTSNTAASSFLSSEDNLTSGTPRAQNKKRINYYTFAQDEITNTANGDDLTGAVRDGFGNVEIAVIFDRNADGVIKSDEKDDSNSDAFSDVYSSAEKAHYVQKSDIKNKIPASGVRSGVIFYSAGSGKTDAGATVIKISDAILSWE